MKRDAKYEPQAEAFRLTDNSPFSQHWNTEWYNEHIFTLQNIAVPYCTIIIQQRIAFVNRITHEKTPVYTLCQFALNAHTQVVKIGQKAENV